MRSGSPAWQYEPASVSEEVDDYGPSQPAAARVGLDANTATARCTMRRTLHVGDTQWPMTFMRVTMLRTRLAAAVKLTGVERPSIPQQEPRHES